MNDEMLLRQLVGLAGGPEERGYVLALDGEGLDTVPDRLDAGTTSYTVHRPTTELALRRLVAKANGAPFIALLPENLAHGLPPDLVRRARKERIHALDTTDVLATLLGVPITGVDDREVQQLALEFVAPLRDLVKQRTVPTVIDSKLLDELLLDACLGGRLRTEDPGRILAAWVTKPPEHSKPLASLLQRSLPVLHGTEGRVLAWALKEPSRLRELLVRGALLDIDGDHAPVVWGGLFQQWEALRQTESEFRSVVVRLARGAIQALGDDAMKLLREAETIGNRNLGRGLLATSKLLPLGLDTRLDKVAKRARLGPVPSSEIEWMREHRAAAGFQAEIDLVEELARLARWLATPPIPCRTAGEFVRAYQRSSAFADWAAERLRRAMAASTKHQDDAAAVLARYRQRRDTENLAFAETLASGYVGAIHSDEVVPLHKLFPLLAKTMPREIDLPVGFDRAVGAGGLFLVVLDGCSYPVFLELLSDLSRRPRPIGLRLVSDEAIGLPGIAPLPTITSHARSAIFLGKIPQDPWLPEAAWREGKEAATDPARFQQNEALAGLSRKLFLKGDLGGGFDGLLSALRDPELDVVAAVFNAVDDQIGSSNTGSRPRIRAEDVFGFVPALQTAIDQKRRVLVVADHGHSPFWGKDLRVGAGSTPRWVAPKAGEEVPEGFLEIDLAGLGGTQGRTAFAWKMGVYQGMPQVGFHGGCGLEEMVVPMAWLGQDGVPADEPAWWHGFAEAATRSSATGAGAWTAPAWPDAPKASPSAASGPLPGLPGTSSVDSGQHGASSSSPAASASTAGGRKDAVPQGDLFGASPIERLAGEIARLRLSDDAVARLDVHERAALGLLVENRVVRAGDLAVKLGRNPARISGFMTQLGRKLHAQGIDAFDTEGLPDGELQYRLHLEVSP